MGFTENEEFKRGVWEWGKLKEGEKETFFEESFRSAAGEVGAFLSLEGFLAWEAVEGWTSTWVLLWFEMLTDFEWFNCDGTFLIRVEVKEEWLELTVE